MKHYFLIISSFFVTAAIQGQCGNWESLPNKDELVEYHVLYQQALGMEDYAEAFNNWNKVFPVAPAADGKRDVQYLEGIKIYNHQFTNGDESAKDKALALYDQVIKCYTSGGLKTANEEELNKKLGFLYGRKAYDMFYTYNSLYSETLEAIENAIKYGGVHNEYVIFAPGASIAAYNIKNGTMEKAKAVELYTKLNEIADYNINNDDNLADYYTQAKENMNGTFATIEDEIFDCEYFKEKLTPDYESDPENPEVLKYIIVTLKQKGCADTDPFLVELEEKWSKYASEVNAQRQAEFEANNPAVVAKQLYDQGKFGEAIAKYDEAIAIEEDNEKKASYLFSKASIQFRKLASYSSARSTALEAARLKPNWGNPYMLIGDMYAKSARSCGDAWTQRLAILAAVDKYAYAKQVDPSIADEASKRMGNYRGSYPDKETGFLKGVKEGDSASVGCWIGETVRVRYN